MFICFDEPWIWQTLSESISGHADFVSNQSFQRMKYKMEMKSDFK